MANEDTKSYELIKSVHPARPDWAFLLPKENKEAIERLQIPIPFPQGQKPCTKVISLLPKTLVQGHTGIGHFMTNIDGFRYINAYVISDPLNSSTQRGFTLELSFSVNDFVYGVGVIGETSFAFNFEDYYDPGNSKHRSVNIETDYLTSSGGLPWIGGNSLTHILRVPVMGPYIRASVFNEDTVARNVEVKAYLVS